MFRKIKQIWKAPSPRLTASGGPQAYMSDLDIDLTSTIVHGSLGTFERSRAQRKADPKINTRPCQRNAEVTMEPEKLLRYTSKSVDPNIR